MSTNNHVCAARIDDRGRILNAFGPITSGPVGGENWTTTKATVAGFAGATSFTVTNSRYFRLGNRVMVQAAGTWVPNAATSSGTITMPTNLVPPVGVTKVFIGEMLLNPSNQGTGVGAVTTTLGTTDPNLLTIATTNGGTSNIPSSTFFLTGSYNLSAN